jgi:hypothetical protein
MLFKNEHGEIVELADNLTLQELAEMGIDISLVEHDTVDKNKPQQEHWEHPAGS